MHLWGRTGRFQRREKEWNQVGAGHFAAVAAKKSCGLEVKEGRNRYKVIAGNAQVSEVVGRLHQQDEEIDLEPQAQTVQDGEERQPEEHGVEFSLQKGKRR